MSIFKVQKLWPVCFEQPFCYTARSNSTLVQVFDWKAAATWEFTSNEPIRSFFPLWLAYGFPLTVLKWIWEGLGYGAPLPMTAFYTLRGMMFTLSFVLEDWALHELVPGPRERTRAIALVASSYVTWTFQTHTFSNSIETLLVLWCMVLIKRIRENRKSTMASACIGLAFMGVLGIFNRITFPAFLIIPAVRLVPHLFVRRLRIPLMLVTAALTFLIAITVDTEIYADTRPQLRNLIDSSIITPWNNLSYNLNPENLAKHGLHPFWQHIGAQLTTTHRSRVPVDLPIKQNEHPLLVRHHRNRNPFVFQTPRTSLPTTRRALTLILNQHPPTPHKSLGRLLDNLQRHSRRPLRRIPPRRHSPSAKIHRAAKTRCPSLLVENLHAHRCGSTVISKKSRRQTSRVLDHSKITSELFNKGHCVREQRPRHLLVAPASATFLDKYIETEKKPFVGITLQELWRYDRHIGLDDLDFEEDGVWPTLQRVIGRRGLVIWQINKQC